MDNSVFRKYLVLTVSLFVLVIVLAITSLPDKNLHIIACDVGQGDATLIRQGLNEILIDGGPDNSVLNCLGKYLPFWDRKIEMVILTHPQSDHFIGLIEVLRCYNVGIFLANALDNPGNEGYQVLKKEVGSRGIKVVNPVAGQRLRLGLIHIDIVWPAQEFAKPQIPGKLGGFTTDGNLNDYSVVALFRFGNFTGLTTGDIGSGLNQNLSITGLLGRVDYIKVPHHGSKYGLSGELLAILVPKVATISVGKNNHFGHPSPEVLKLLGDRGARVLRTDQLGDIEIISDGKSYWIR